MGKVENSRYGIGNSPINCILKRIGLLEEIKSVQPPKNLDDMEPKQELLDLFIRPYSPIIFYSGDKGEDWLIYLRRHFRRRTPFFLHIGTPVIPRLGRIKGNDIIYPKGHISLKLPLIKEILKFLSEAEKIGILNSEERNLVFFLYGWEKSLEARASLAHVSRINDLDKMIFEMRKIINEKNLRTWQEIRYEIERKPNIPEDGEKKEADNLINIKFRSILNTIERHWGLNPIPRKRDKIK